MIWWTSRFVLGRVLASSTFSQDISLSLESLQGGNQSERREKLSRIVEHSQDARAKEHRERIQLTNNSFDGMP